MKTLMTLIVATCFVGTAFGQQPSEPPKPDPELKAYRVWRGD